VKALLVGESGAAGAVEERIHALGGETSHVALDSLSAEIAGADGAVVILFADGDASDPALASSIEKLRDPHQLSDAPLFVVTGRAAPSALAVLRVAGADECLAWPDEAPLFDARYRALAERVALAQRVAASARVEHELRTSEERLRQLVELASDSIFIKDRSGRYVFVNPAGARALGFSPAEVIGKTDVEIFGERTGREVIRFDQLAMTSRKPIHYEARQTVQGEERIFTTSKFAYVSPVGDLLGIAGITRDMTDQRLTEEAETRRTKQHLAHQAALVALAQLEIGADFVPALEKVLDTAGEALSLSRVSYWSLRDDPPTVVSQAMRAGGSGSWANGLEARARDLPRYFETLEQARVYAVEDACASTEGTPLRREYLDPNGVTSLLDASVWVRGSIVGVVCHESQGERRAWTHEEKDFAVRIAQVISMALVDRERDLAALEVQRSESRMRTLIEHLPDAIFVLHDGCFVFVNAAFAAYLGYEKPEDVIGAPLIDLVHAEDTKEGRAIERGTPKPRKVRLLRRDGESVCAEVAGLSLVWDGEPSTVAIARDLTERNRFEAQLLLADRMASVGTLAAGVAHEINNPLGYVLGNLTALQNGLSSEAVAGDVGQALKDAIHGAKRVRDIVQDLQTFSRGDDAADGARRESRAVDVLRVMDVSIRMAHSAVRHRARLERDYRLVPAVEGSESRLGQVFVNLIVNAAQAMPERPPEENEIQVRVTLDGEHVVVEVRDNGAGMTEAVRRRIFDPFFTTKPIGEGTGLGLSICHNIITSMNGALEVESEVGLGTTFRVRLPVARTQVRTESIEPPPLQRERREKVLVIDDEPMIGVMIRRLLAAHCDVLPVTHAREALRRIAAQERFDAILCDLMMPRMSGIEFYTELSTLSPEMAKRTGFLTGGAVTLQARRFVQDHADVTLEKPVEIGKLRAFVQMLARRGTDAPSSRHMVAARPKPPG
jgi:PAS domain S-box-containing protein